jgi:hypothetical protein
MRYKLIFLPLIICWYSAAAQAPETRQKLLGFETGMNFFPGKVWSMDNIRGDMPAYSYASQDNKLISESFFAYAGIKAEYFTLDNKYGLATGLRYMQMNSSVNKNESFFYWLYRQEGVNTEYLKVKEINQKTDYIGIPVEVKCFVFVPSWIRWYVKAGAEVSFKMNSQTDVKFYDEAMMPYEDGVTTKVPDTGSFSSSLYAAGGARVGKDSKPSVCFEICLPSVLLTQESTGLVHSTAGFGFQFNVQIPLK